jgi:hypothetical protein
MHPVPYRQLLSCKHYMHHIRVCKDSTSFVAARAHAGRMQNLEEVWKREQQAEAEQRKLEELRKQYEDERKNAEFTQMAEDAGFK